MNLSVPVRELSVAVIRAESTRRRRALRRFDKELANRNYKAAHSQLKQLLNKPGGLIGFASAKLVPKNIPAMNTQQLCMVDSILSSIKYSINFDPLSDDEHEAGHFLVGYLVGVIPRSYEVPSVEDITQNKFAQGNVRFLGFEFIKEETRAKISSQTLNKFLCVILGGLAAEHLVFGYSELLHSDVQKLDRVLRLLCFNENEAESLVRWAVLTTLSLLSHHQEALSRLAEAMASRRSIGYCIDVIESTL
ncbi:hypothetical protein BC332_31308 [Capsicum chinense]|uniref:uncharacterized protein LOC107851827 isoform X2 n=1 Tax=Capsicum annuum TaxID=4072 RepID=UPI000C0D3419|nr:uncharacterized protein LOC107851827 isoform X2 [Capsicum annuum]PHU01521.1 hypothetical protein BC332_31308 [Capsicum chinense]